MPSGGGSRQLVEETPAKQLRWILQIAKFPSRKFEVVNTGMLRSIRMSCRIAAACRGNTCETNSDRFCRLRLLFSTPVLLRVVVQISLRIAGVGFATKHDSVQGKVMLRGKFPSRKFEEINTGNVAINSHVAQNRGGTGGSARFVHPPFGKHRGRAVDPGTMLTSAGIRLPVVHRRIFFRPTRMGQLVTRLGTKKHPSASRSLASV